MRRISTYWLLAGGVWLSGATASRAAIICIQDTQPQIDFNVPCDNCDKKAPAQLPFALFDYSSQPSLTSLTSLELTMTMYDGDTGAGEFDFGNLKLALDSVNTGIQLNGFVNEAEKTITFSLKEGDAGWLSTAKVNALLNDLNADGQLFASILDATPDNNMIQLSSQFDTTLKLCGEGVAGGGGTVPEPASILVWAASAAGLAWRRRRAISA